MYSGIVKYFNDGRGYGFILCDAFSEDILVHHARIEMDGYKSLTKGSQVLLDVAKRPEGLIATRVVPLEKQERLHQGIVLWFNDQMGFGFIESRDFDEQIFVHHDYIEMKSYRSLKKGQMVVFRPEKKTKGYHATSVRPVELKPNLSQAGDNQDDKLTSRNQPA